MKQTNRRNFLGRGGATAGAPAAVAVPAGAQPDKPTKRGLYEDGKKPAKTPLFNSTVAYGNLLFIAGVGAHVPGDIKSHTKIVLDSIHQQLESVGSSMEKVLKANVYLNDIKDWADMNTVFQGRLDRK